MKILVTGFSGQQAGKSTRTKYESVVSLYVKGMRALGHEVGQKEILPNETLDGVDLLFVGLTPPLSIAAHYACLTLYALGKAWMSGVPVIFYVDDWRFTQMISQYKTINKNTDRLFTPKPMMGRIEAEWAAGIGRKPIEAVCETMFKGDWPPVIVPRFGWADDQKPALAVGHKLPTRKLIHLDPTSMATPYPIDQVPDEARGRRWVLGILSDQMDWLEKMQLGWGLLHYGNTTSKASSSIPEAELVSSYGRTWGVLSPPYTQLNGTGWWRNRYVYSARARCILLADPKESPALGDPYTGVMPNLGLVENASNEQLRNLAEAQASALRAGVWSYEMFLGRLEEELQAAVTQRAEAPA